MEDIAQLALEMMSERFEARPWFSTRNHSCWTPHVSGECVGCAELDEILRNRRAGMANPVVHFESGCKDSKATQSFYANLFDWKIVQVMAGNDRRAARG